MKICHIITGLFNGQYCFTRWCLSSVGVVCNAAGRRAGQPPGAWSVGRPTLHGEPVRLRTVRATPCLNKIESVGLNFKNLSALGDLTVSAAKCLHFFALHHFH